MNTSLEAICYRSKLLADGSSPIMLRLTKEGKRKYVSLHISVKPAYWDFNKNAPKRNCPDKDVIVSIIEKRTAAYREQINEYKVENKDYTLESLVQRVENPVRNLTLGGYLDMFISQLIQEERLGYAESFKGLKSSLLSYCKSLDIKFSAIDNQWLKGYELHLKKGGKAQNTIGIRFRSLRALYNKAIADKVIKKEYYPFDSFKISQFHERTSKRAIKREDIKKIIDLDLRTITNYRSPYLELGRDLFIFSYLTCGINLADMARIRYADIFDGRLAYHRKKTNKLISCKLQEPALAIIEKYRKEDSVSEDYIFPILNRKVHRTEVQKRDKIRKANKAANKALHKIEDKIGIPIDLTTYVARHTYATVLKRSGVNIALISESLGHSDISTTQIYLDSFENSQIDEAMQNLL